ncbi:DUF1636 family protein [Pararhodobacter sp. CCB-MM2]|uniref:DUF1636 family protein n=1 Tax=Pararhodobacter sp. CCB-MM2 TaxID=1786003 RepID=UPI0009F5ECBE
MPKTFTLHLCVGCMPARSASDDSPAVEGQAWHDVLRSAVEDAPGLSGCRIQSFSCLGGCGSRSRFSVSAPGRWSILFGGIEAGTESQMVVAFLETWLECPDGIVPKFRRPAALTRRLLGRVPPMISGDGHA